MSPGLGKGGEEGSVVVAEEWAAEWKCHPLCKCHSVSGSLSVCLAQAPHLCFHLSTLLLVTLQACTGGFLFFSPQNSTYSITSLPSQSPPPVSPFLQALVVLPLSNKSLAVGDPVGMVRKRKRDVETKEGSQSCCDFNGSCLPSVVMSLQCRNEA